MKSSIVLILVFLCLTLLFSACGTTATSIPTLPATEEVIPSNTAPIDTNTPEPTETLASTPTLQAEAEGLIAYTSDKAGDWEIFVRTIGGDDERNLTNHPGSDIHPTWSPQGDKLLFYSDRDGNYEIYVMNADGSGQKNLSKNPAQDIDADWSPDGKQIVFSSDRDGNLEIYKMNSDGSTQQRLTKDTGSDVAPGWSPDGKKIVFSSNRKGNYEILVMNSDGSNPLYLTSSGGENDYPAWSSDGELIAFMSSRDGFDEIWIMEANGDNPIALPRVAKGVSAPGWSPDGKWIAFTYIETKTTGVSYVNVFSRSIVELTGHYDNYVFPDWAPNPLTVYSTSTDQQTALTPLETFSPDDLQEELKNEWGGVVTNSLIMLETCSAIFIKNADLQFGNIDRPTVVTEVAEKRNILASAQRSLKNIPNPTSRVAPYRQWLLDLGDELSSLLSQMASGELGTEAMTFNIGQTCQKLLDEDDRIKKAASEAGLTSDSFTELEAGIQNILSEISD